MPSVSRVLVNLVGNSKQLPTNR